MEIILYAVLAGLALALSLTTFGSIIAWKRSSYLSDAIAHSSLLGVTLSYLYNISANIIIIPICFIFSFTLVYLNKKFNVAKDSILLFNTQLSLALSFIIISLFIQVPLTSFFFGSILSVSLKDIIIMYVIAVFALIYLYTNWEKIILATINTDVAQSENINTFLQEVILIFVLSSIVSFAIKIAGVLLIPSLMILPNMVASGFAKNPLTSLVIAFIVSGVCITLGILTSVFVDVAVAPLITLYLVGVILVSLLYYKK
ncbi:High-affinity zinc uptake system membrane protein ZnuB [Candidatus Hepatincola sp. Av]